MPEATENNPAPVIDALFIDGQWRAAASKSTFPVTNPATGELLAEVSDASVDDVRAAIAAADAALPAWSKRTAYERADVLFEAHRRMLERSEQLAKLMTEEQGKPIRMAAATRSAMPPTSCSGSPRKPNGSTDETIPSARADQRFLVLRPAGRRGGRHHSLELPGLDDHPQGRRRRWRPAARSCSSPPSRPRCARSRCSASSRRPVSRPASSTW